MNIKLLLDLGLNESEIKIYIHLNKFHVQTVKQLSEITKINRTTLYRYLNTLAKKGLIEWIVDERGAKVQTTSPNNLALFLRNKKIELASIEKELPQLIKDLSAQKPSEIFSTQIRYYKDKEGVQQLFWNVLHSKETTRSYAPLRRREYIQPKFEEELEEEWVNHQLRDKVITNENRMDYIKKNFTDDFQKTLDIRIIPSDKLYITNDITIYDNIVAIASFEKDNLVGIEIENAEISKTQKSIFDLVWSIAEPLGNYLT